LSDKHSDGTNLLSFEFEQLGNLLSLCREIAGARDILQKFENTTRVEFQLMILHF
jgi:hypothetical protein